MIRTTAIRADEPGLRPLLGGLDELGFEAPDAGEIISSFSRHLMTAFDQWSEAGVAPLARHWLERASPGGRDARIADDGDLLVSGTPRQGFPLRQGLAEALASPSWLDPATGTPWL